MNYILSKVKEMAIDKANALDLEIIDVEWVNEYGTNILRNARLITNERSTLYRILDFLYYVMSLRVLERCVYLRDYFEYEKRDRSVS